jgi:hypothetical protein
MGGYGNCRGAIFGFKRMVLSLTLASQFLCAMPVGEFCDPESDTLQIENLVESEIQLLSKFDEMKSSFALHENRNLEAIKSIQFLLDEVSFKYNITASLSDLFQITKTKLNGMELNDDIRPFLIQVIQNFETTHDALHHTITETILEPIPTSRDLHMGHFEVFGYGIYPPWEWNWFGANKKKSKSNHPLTFVNKQVTYPGPIPEDDGSIPDDLIICGVEALAATLLFLIPSGYTQGAAIVIVGDMVFRAGDGLKELSAQNRNTQKNPPHDQRPIGNH